LKSQDIDPHPDAVLLDDDALVHATWKIAARSKGINLTGFRTPCELLAAAGLFAKELPIYIDSELGGGLRGEEVAKDLHERGFTHLILTTGFDPDTLPPLPWIEQVIGKEPPWGDDA